MIARVESYSLFGLEGVPVTVEADISKGIPSFDMVGLPDAAVKESRERVKSAVKNSGLMFPGTAYYLTSSASPTILRCISYAYMNTSTQNITVTGSRYTGMLVRPVYSPNDK